ncbi:MAG: AraC family transcriptional regulator [Marivirga sp.]|nr:AraC family transcriptional regulator [Marivirga sp.]
MKVSYLTPADIVSEYVKNILVIENCRVTNPFVLPLYANGTPTLLFQTAKGQIKNNSNYLTLFGQTVLPDTLTIHDNFTLIAYFFKPYSVNSLFGVLAQELTDKPIDLKLLSSTKTALLQEQLLNAASTAEMISLLDNYIFRLAEKVKIDTPLIKYATQQITIAPGKEILTTVQHKLCVTERTFQRMFEKNIGISPNQFRRIAQFNAAFQQLNRRQYTNMSDIVFGNGYADQSHYIRAFKEFTNLTPKEYLNYGS